MPSPQELPSLTALQAFEAALRHQSFTRAARELHVTQGAVSRQVAQLEGQLGVSLFHREHPRVRPTRAAEAYGAKLRVLLDRLAAITLELQTSGGEGGLLSLSILPTFGTTWLIPRMPAFFAAHPLVQINFTTSLQAFDFESEEVDAAIHYGEGVWPGARVEPLMEERVTVVCHPDLAAREKLRGAKDLADQTLLQLTSRPGAWEDWFAQNDVSDLAGRRGPRFEQHLMVLQAARAGLGIALLPSFLAAKPLNNGELVEPFPQTTRVSANAYWLVYPERSLELASLHAFRKWLRTELRAAGFEPPRTS